uniref:CRAL-TRIO domain-containing protein n=1 Tax=Clastoptera arizonana TaxID=38151 RepID=A0A1B6E930_9HEMI
MIISNTILCVQPRQCFPLGATQEGHQIIMYRLLNPDASQHCFTLDIQLLSLATEVIQHKTGTFPGVTILTDFDKASIRHMLWAKWGHLRVAMQYLQEGFPSRLESIQTLSSTAFVDYALIAIKPFTNSQVLNKMVYHNITNLSTLYEKIPKENLPSDYGGLLPSCDEINSDYMKEVISMKSYFDEKDALHNSSGVKVNK